MYTLEHLCTCPFFPHNKHCQRYTLLSYRFTAHHFFSPKKILQWMNTMRLGFLLQNFEWPWTCRLPRVSRYLHPFQSRFQTNLYGFSACVSAGRFSLVGKLSSVRRLPLQNLRFMRCRRCNHDDWTAPEIRRSAYALFLALWKRMALQKFNLLSHSSS